MIDEKDMEILRALKEDSKRSINALSKITGIPPATVHHRIRKLEQDKVIKRYSISVDKEKIGFPIGAYIFITVKPSGEHRLDQREIANKLARHEFVEEASVLTGEVDMMLKVRVRSMNDLDKFVLDYLRNFEGIERTRTLITLYASKALHV